ncbi:MAG: hypothetical protein V4561_07215 [Bacteroidota bacterium]
MELDIDNIANYYSKMRDQELIRIATQDARGLRPEVYNIVEKEIKKRNLNPDLLKGAIAQNKEYSIEELEKYAEKLRELQCPICGQIEQKLNGTIAHSIMSFLIFTTYKTEPFIACPDCLDKKNNNAIISSTLLGWWGIPWGLLKTPTYIYRNLKAKRQNHVSYSNDTMLSFTLSNIGELETYGNDKTKLRTLIK